MPEPSKDPRGVPATKRLNYTAYRLARALNRAAENTALAHEVTLPQLLILQVLGEGRPLSNAQIARRTFVSSQASHSVSRELLERKLIEHVDHPMNRRVRLIRMTEAGWKVLAECTSELREREDRLIEMLGTPIGDTLHTSLHRAAEALGGGYFGDAEAEATAVGQRQRSRKGPGLSAS